jgi:hypothetical protein
MKRNQKNPFITNSMGFGMAIGYLLEIKHESQ